MDIQENTIAINETRGCEEELDKTFVANTFYIIYVDGQRVGQHTTHIIKLSLVLCAGAQID